MNEENRFRERRSAFSDEPEHGEAPEVDAAPPVETPEIDSPDVVAPGSVDARDTPPASPGSETGEAEKPAPETVEILRAIRAEIAQVLGIRAIQLLGATPLDETGRTVSFPRWSHVLIDMMEMLHEGTRDVMPEEDTRQLEAMLADLRAEYVSKVGGGS